MKTAILKSNYKRFRELQYYHLSHSPNKNTNSIDDNQPYNFNNSITIMNTNTDNTSNTTNTMPLAHDDLHQHLDVAL